MLTWFRSLTQSAGTKTVQGVDVSSFQGTPGGWSNVAGNIAWAAVKVTELEPDGTRYVNPDAAADWEWLRIRNKGRIAFLFGHPSVSAAPTVDLFLGELARIGLNDSDAVALNVEVSDGLPPAAVASWAADVQSELHARVGRPPLLYTFLEFAQEGNCAHLGGYPLWIADANSPAGHPVIPAPWRTWAIHQHDISGPIDRDVANFANQTEMFGALGKHATTPPPPPKEPTLINVGGNVSTIATARWPDGQMVVAGVAADGYVQAARWDGVAWSDWGGVSPTRAIGTPSLIAWVDGLGLLFYVDESGAVVELTTTNRGKSWA